MSQTHLANLFTAAIAIVCGALLAGCTGGGSQTAPTAATSAPTDNAASLAALKSEAQTAIGPPGSQVLAAVGGGRKDGFSNHPLLTDSPPTVKLVVVCNGGGNAPVSISGATTTVACDSTAHVIDTVKARDLILAVPANPGNTGDIFVAVAHT